MPPHCDYCPNLRRPHPLERLGWPEEVAEIVAYLLPPSSSFVNGAVVSVDGGRRARSGVRSKPSSVEEVELMLCSTMACERSTRSHVASAMERIQRREV
jgi:hypothetical protein